MINSDLVEALFFLWQLGRLQKLAPQKPTDQLALPTLELPRDAAPLPEQSLCEEIA